MEHLSLCRDSVRGTRKGGSFSGGSERYAKRALEMEHLSLCRAYVRVSWGVSFLGNVIDMLRRLW
jgi:hypothetical protein